MRSISCTRARVAGETSRRPLSTLETVAIETPADAATVASVVRGSVVDISVLSRAGWLVARSQLDARGRVQTTVVTDDAGGTGELDGDPGSFVGGRGADDELHLASLDDPVHRRVGVGSAVGVHVEDDLRRGPGLEVDPREADQLPTGRATRATGSCR